MAVARSFVHSATAKVSVGKKRLPRTASTSWNGSIQRPWASKSVPTPCVLLRRRMRYIMRRILPRCKSGWGTRTFRQLGFTITVRPGQKTAQPSRSSMGSYCRRWLDALLARFERTRAVTSRSSVRIEHFCLDSRLKQLSPNLVGIADFANN
jgi:hypothetical protein